MCSDLREKKVARTRFKWDIATRRVLRHARTIIRNLLVSYIEKSFLVLDAGCGPYGGCIAEFRSNIQGIGLDISRENIEESVRISKKHRQNSLSFLVADIQRMPFRENIFDIISCQDVLEHVRNKQNAVDEMAFSLKRGGKMLITTSNSFNPGMLIDETIPKRVSEILVYRFRRTNEYERQGRLNPWSLNSVLLTSSLILRKMVMVGGGPWIRQPIICRFWIIFEMLTSIGFLRNFKETIIAVCEK